MGIVSVGLVGRMWGREDIEWKDRSWRLMENKGQLETEYDILSLLFPVLANIFTSYMHAAPTYS
jgi:hypothetical protein